MDFYKNDLKSIFKNLKTSNKGLTNSEAKARIEKYGYNRIESKKKISPWIIFFQQFNDPVIFVLIGALIISAAVGFYEFKHGQVDLMQFLTEPLVIAAIVIANAIIGFIQEYNAEKAIEALKRMASLKAVVLRDGEETEVEAEELVPGDVILLCAGEKVPADSRLLSVINLQTQEAALTGESLPVKKEVITYKTELQLGDRKNMLFSGTVITEGKGTALVVKTGMDTEIGNIAKLIDETENSLTPLQIKLDKVGKFLTWLTLVICVIIFGTLIFKGEPLISALITSLTLAVAAIPEGLPAIVTVSLALGVKRMIKKNALIRKLPSVETLGSTTVICSDKTGTLTKNEMTVKKVYVDNVVVEVSGSGYEPQGTFSNHPEDLDLLLKIGVLNNDAKLEKSKEGYKIIGDPTEGALIVSGEKAGFNYYNLVKQSPRLDELLFDSKRKRMTTIHNIDNKKVSFVKGAPDIIISQCDRIIINGKIQKMSASDKKAVLKQNEDFSSEALRVLGFAYKELSVKDNQDKYEQNLIFVGLQGMIDPPRQEVKDSIVKCKTAGIKVVMITGDYLGTAKAIADELGITGKAVQGKDIEKLDLAKEVEKIGVYARVDPEHKMRIVEALKKNGHIVAMTGDGVNDAPALKAADIGIAMGITGTDVSKEASDMILTDDNFSSIVNAIEEGRGIYDNIKKFLQYLLSSNFGEVLVLFFATILSDMLGFINIQGNPLIPLLPVQILWMNLVTDGLPALALGVDPSSKEIMNKKPRSTTEGLLTKAFGVKVFYTGTLIAIATIFIFWYGLNVLKVSDAHAQTMAFTTLVMLQFVRIYIIRSEYKLAIFSNMKLIGAIVLSILLQVMVVYTNFGKSLFETAPLNGTDWLLIFGVSLGLLVISSIVNKILPMLNVQGD